MKYQEWGIKLESPEYVHMQMRQPGDRNILYVEEQSGFLRSKRWDPKHRSKQRNENSATNIKKGAKKRHIYLDVWGEMKIILSGGILVFYCYKTNYYKLWLQTTPFYHLTL